MPGRGKTVQLVLWGQVEGTLGGCASYTYSPAEIRALGKRLMSLATVPQEAGDTGG